MIAQDVAGALQERFGGTVQDVVRFRGEVTALVSHEAVSEVCAFLRDDLNYRFLSDVTAVDWLDRSPRFDVVYHLLNLDTWAYFRLKAQVDEGESVPTVTSLWGAAHWAEREVYDLFGINFAGHPNLQRLLLPEGWIGFPLRKDYPQTQITLPRPRADKIEE